MTTKMKSKEAQRDWNVCPLLNRTKGNMIEKAKQNKRNEVYITNDAKWCIRALGTLACALQYTRATQRLLLDGKWLCVQVHKHSMQGSKVNL